MRRVKICGITNLSDAKLAVKLGANYLGFIFYKSSPRRITPQKADSIIKEIKNKKQKVVAVFVNETKENIIKISQKIKPDVIQLHGNETPQFCKDLKKELIKIKKPIKLIKAFRIKNKATLKKTEGYTSPDYYLFDTYKKGSFGGTGKTFDWKIIKKTKKPIFLSGGLNPKNINNALKKRVFALDISSGIEKKPGKKDPKKLKELFNNLK
ncbi:phosphoribosylanthranilate isomerase [Nanoarchaeota archaeon]